MKKYLSYYFLSSLWNKSKNYACYIFAIATTVLTFISIEDILKKLNCNKISVKIIILITLLLISILIAFLTIKNIENKEITIHTKEKANIKVKFDDMENYITNNNSSNYTVVVPINTELKYVADINEVKPNSIHGIWLKKMLGFGYTREEISDIVLEQIQTNNKGKCKIGDFCYIKNVKNVNYLLVATCDLTKDKKSICTETQYFCGIQKMIDTLAHECDLQEKIFLPIIGGGYAFMEKSNQELLEILSEVLIFNIQKLQHEIVIIVYEKLKDQVSISKIYK